MFELLTDILCSAVLADEERKSQKILRSFRFRMDESDL